MSEDSKVMQVIQFTGCTEDIARNALELENWNVLDTIDRIAHVPAISGSKYVPSTPSVENQMSSEVREKLQQARKLADILTFAPQNDLRGKASHYPVTAPEQKE